MVTGDHYLTAQAIAAQVSIIKDVDDVDMYTTPQSLNLQKNDPFVTRFSSAAEQFQKLADNKAATSNGNQGDAEIDATAKKTKKSWCKKRVDTRRISTNSRATTAPSSLPFHPVTSSRRLLL